jgi:hypothetical protein
MIITYLGHKSFCVEDNSSIILINPWLSKYGAYDNTWYQFPRNHHLNDKVRTKFLDTKFSNSRYIYITNNSPVNYDVDFTGRLPMNIGILLPKSQQKLKDKLKYKFNKIVLIDNSFELPNGTITLDTNENITINMGDQTFTILNENSYVKPDDKLDDSHTMNNLTVAASPYVINDFKIINQYKNINDLLTELNPKYFIPMNPPVFLDPDLYDLNFVEDYPIAGNMVSQSTADMAQNTSSNILIMNSGDTVNPETNEKHITSIYGDGIDFADYMDKYRLDIEYIYVRKIYAAKQGHMNSSIDLNKSMNLLYDQLVKKLIAPNVQQHDKYYILNLDNYKGNILLDFNKEGASIISIMPLEDLISKNIPKDKTAIITLHIVLLNHLLEKTLSWKDLFMTFKLGLNNLSENDLGYKFLVE